MKPEVFASPACLSGRKALPHHCIATGIGSLPHQDPEEAVRLVLKIFPGLPSWPQLPCRSPKERMTEQFDHPILYWENAAGFFEFIKALQHQRPPELCGIKGQITGPATWLASNYKSTMLHERVAGPLREDSMVPQGPAPATARTQGSRQASAVSLPKCGVRTEGREPIGNSQGARGQDPPCSDKIGVLLDETTERLAMNAVWQIEQLQQFGVPVMIFLDEPVLGSLSRYPSLSSTSLMKTWTGIVNAIHEAGGLAGIHCCNQMDWGPLLCCPLDIISFDASLSFQDLLPHVEELKKFMDRNGRLSWGVIPTSRTVADSEGDHPHDLEAFEKLIWPLSGHGIDLQRLVRQSIVTPACGLASVSHQAMDEILHRAAGLANDLKNWTPPASSRRG